MGESKGPELDVVRLVEDLSTLTAEWEEAGKKVTYAVGPALAGMNAVGPAVIRAARFEKSGADWNAYWQEYSKDPLNPRNPGFWVSEYTGLPCDSVALWSSGGPIVRPTYYVLDKRGAIWRRAPAARPPDDRFIPILPDGTVFVPPVNAKNRERKKASHEALFVDPHRTGRLFLFATFGILFSEDHGYNWQMDGVLRAVTTEGGRYKYQDRCVGRSLGEQVGPRNNVSCMAFHPRREEVAAGSLFGGVFIRDRNRVWRDLSWLLPQPMVMVAGPAMTDDALFVGTHGYGLWRIRGFERAPVATYWVPRAANGGPDEAGTLFDATGNPVAGGKVMVRARRANEVYTRTRGGREEVVMTDGLGKLSLQSMNLGSGDFVVHLRYGGEGGPGPMSPPRLGPCSTTISVRRP